MLPHQEDKELTKKDILDILGMLDKDITGFPHKIKLYSLGGTKLVLSDLRHSSKDVDFIVSRNDFQILSGSVAELEWRNHIRFDLFPDGMFPGFKYASYARNAKPSPFLFNNIEIYYLDDIDIVLTKALAGRDVDFQDINKIAAHENIPKQALIERFKRIEFEPGKAKELKANFERFLVAFYKE